MIVRVYVDVLEATVGGWLVGAVHRHVVAGVGQRGHDGVGELRVTSYRMGENSKDTGRKSFVDDKGEE